MRPDLTRTVLAVLAIGLLIGLTLWILSPFLPATVWATMIVVATWPLMLACQQRLGGRRWLAVTVMTITMLLIFVVPLSLSISTIVENTDRITDWVHSLGTVALPPPPDWVDDLPLFGERLAALWRETAEAGATGLREKLAPYGGRLVAWFASQVGSWGLMALQFLLTVVISSILYASGESAAEGVRSFARRLAGEHGDSVVQLAAQAIRGVALGVVVTALAQSLLGGVGLAIAGVPFVTILTAIMFMLAIAQIGVGPVLVLCVIWLYWSGSTGWGTFLLVWSIVVGAMDNVLRPILIKKGAADLPLLVIFAGVIGGLVTLGLVGIFVGPVVLAVTYMLVQAWTREGLTPTSPSPPGSAP